MLTSYHAVFSVSVCPIYTPATPRNPWWCWVIYMYLYTVNLHDDVIKWNHFPRYWPFVWRIHRSPVNSPHKGQWRGAVMFSLIWAWINGWVNNREAGDLRHYRAHYDAMAQCDSVVVFVCAVWLTPFYVFCVSVNRMPYWNGVYDMYG